MNAPRNALKATSRHNGTQPDPVPRQAGSGRSTTAGPPPAPPGYAAPPGHAAPARNEDPGQQKGPGIRDHGLLKFLALR